MNLVDRRLDLILGRPVKVNEFLSVKQYTLKEISEVGYSSYLGNISFILRSVDDILKMLIDTDFYMEFFLRKHELSEYIMQLFLSGNDEYRKELEHSLSFVLGVEQEKIHIENDRILYYLSNNDIKLIDEKSFEEIVAVVKIVNGYESAKEQNEGNPFSDKTKAVIEKMKKNREKVSQAKSKDKSDGKARDIADIISAVTAMSNSINKLNVTELTLYQLYDENSRLYAIENYHLTVKASMFGGDGEINDWGEPQ